MVNFFTAKGQKTIPVRLVLGVLLGGDFPLVNTQTLVLCVLTFHDLLCRGYTVLRPPDFGFDSPDESRRNHDLSKTRKDLVLFISLS